MPRPKSPTALQQGANVAARIAFERQARGLSYEALAAHMSEVGCPVPVSALFKIEKGRPNPRKIDVDELIGFSKVFGVDVSELLLPLEVALDHRVADFANRFVELVDSLKRDINRISDLYTEFAGLHDKNPEIYERLVKELHEPKPKGKAKDRDAVALATDALVVAVIDRADSARRAK